MTASVTDAMKANPAGARREQTARPLGPLLPGQTVPAVSRSPAPVDGRLIDRVLERLEDVRARGKGWEARCPAHDDRTPSLAIAFGKGERVLLYCHAGCTYPEIKAALGLQSADLAPGRPVSPASLRPRPNQPAIVAEYTYTDEDERPLYQVVRYDPKSFRQRRWNGAGWTCGLANVRRVLYRLPQIIEAVAAGKTIYIVEGEKDADALTKLGLVATTNPMGAGKWRPEFSKMLAGANVVILPDNDKSGRDHARHVAESLRVEDCDVRVVELPGLPAKGDVSDFLQAHTVAEFMEQLNATTSVEPVVGLTAKPTLVTADSKPALRFPLLSYAELRSIKPPPPLIDGVLFKGGFSQLVAKYDSYKSFIALDLLLCVAHGLDWHGARTSASPAVFQAGEGAAGLARRVEAWRLLNRLPEIGNIHFLPQSLKLNDSQDLADFLAALKGLRDCPGIVTIDTFARSFRGNENGAEDVGRYVEAVDAVREVTGAHVELVHHTGWEGTRSRGSTAIPACVDTEITLERDGDRITVANTKQKDAAPFAKFVLERVEIAGSLAFQRFAPTLAKLSDNERLALGVLVHAAAPIRNKAWLSGTGLPPRSFYNAKNHLLSLGYAKDGSEGFVVTEAGSHAL